MSEPDWDDVVDAFLFPQIDHHLRGAKASYDRETDPSKKREALGGMLCCLMALINLHEPWVKARIASPLRDLATAFSSLNSGAIEPLLTPSTRSGRPPRYSWMRVRAYAAATSAVLIEKGKPEKEADEWVADELHRAGFRKPRKAEGRLDDISITAGTIRGWRKEAREASADNPVRLTYEWLTGQPSLSGDPPVSLEGEPQGIAEQMIRMLCRFDPTVRGM